MHNPSLKEASGPAFFPGKFPGAVFLRISSRAGARKPIVAEDFSVPGGPIPWVCDVLNCLEKLMHIWTGIQLRAAGGSNGNGIQCGWRKQYRI